MHLTKLRDKIKGFRDLKKLKEKVDKEITLFHAKAVNQILKNKLKVDFIGFHGQTIYHNTKKEFQNS